MELQKGTASKPVGSEVDKLVLEETDNKAEESARTPIPPPEPFSVASLMKGVIRKRVRCSPIKSIVAKRQKPDTSPDGTRTKRLKWADEVVAQPAGTNPAVAQPAGETQAGEPLPEAPAAPPLVNTLEFEESAEYLAERKQHYHDMMESVMEQANPNQCQQELVFDSPEAVVEWFMSCGMTEEEANMNLESLMAQMENNAANFEEDEEGQGNEENELIDMDDNNDDNDSEVFDLTILGNAPLLS